MKIIKLNNIRKEYGNCFTYDMSDVGYPGENSGIDRRSLLNVFEDGEMLGPPSSPHDLIRSNGNGSYSHWGNTLYFSSSDNTSCIDNNKEYMITIPSNIDEENDIIRKCVEYRSNHPDFMKDIISHSISTSGSELHSLYMLRSLLIHAQSAKVDLENSICLEIGSSPSNGLAICLGLAGVRHAYLNNICSIDERIPISFCTNISLLSALVLPHKRSIHDVVFFDDDGFCRLNSNIFTVLDKTDALDIGDSVNDVNIIFSFSVLEHMRRLPEISNILTKIAAPNCVSIHSVDARDHTDLLNPLKYLYLTEEEFNLTYSNDHNRWRYSDYIKILENAGWKVEKSLFSRNAPILPNGKTDMYNLCYRGPEWNLLDQKDEISLIIEEKDIAKMDKTFSNYSPQELSILSFCVICRKL